MSFWKSKKVAETLLILSGKSRVMKLFKFSYYSLHSGPLEFIGSKIVTFLSYAIRVSHVDCKFDIK